MAGAAGADVDDAGFAIDLGGDGFEDRLHHLPGGGRAAGHDGRAFARAFLAAGHAGADEAETEVAEPFVAAFGVGVERVAAVDDDVALVEQRDELLDHGIHRTAGLDHDHDLARGGEGLDELLERLRADELFAGMGGDEFVGDRGGAVVNRDLEAAGFHIENEILAHDGQTNQSEVAFAHVEVCRLLRRSGFRRDVALLQPLVAIVALISHIPAVNLPNAITLSRLVLTAVFVAGTGI